MNQNVSTDVNDNSEKQFEQKKEEAQNNLDIFVKQLNNRYVEDGSKEQFMTWLQQNNSDLPFEDAQEWCRQQYDMPLSDYLRQIGILVSNDNAPINESNEEMPSESAINLMTDNSKKRDAQTLRVLPLTINKKKNSEGISNPSELNGTKGKLDWDFIDECVKLDTELFEQYTKNHNLDYGLLNIPGFIRTLHRLEMSNLLKSNKGITYAEYWAIQGLFCSKPKIYWKEMCLEYLKAYYHQADNGMFNDSESCFELDRVRNLCKISTPLYEGCSRITDLQIAEKMSGELSFQPCYCEDNYSFDLALVSGGQILGVLNKTLFRSTGIGLYLVPLIYTHTAVIKNIRLSAQDYLDVVFDLQFKE